MNPNDLVKDAAAKIYAAEDRDFPITVEEIATIITETVVNPMTIEQARLIGRRDGQRDADEVGWLSKERREHAEVVREFVRLLDVCCGDNQSVSWRERRNDLSAKARAILERFPQP